MRQTITKYDWLATGQCPTMGWFGLREPRGAPDEAVLFRMEQGREIGDLARKLFPEGVLVSQRENRAAAESTKDLIANGTGAIFEAAFLAGPFVARADILLPCDGGWEIQEVKSRFSDTTKVRDLIDDLSYTAMVAGRAGLAVRRASLVLIARGFRFGGGPETLFETVDVTEEVMERVEKFEGWADSVATLLLEEDPPEPKLTSACRDCDAFDTKCLGSGMEHTVLEIPALHAKKLNRLSAEGIVDLALLPEDLGLNDRQERARRSALSGNRLVEPGLAAALEQIVWPCYYLDFETVATTLPLYNGDACHKQVLTQFSVHRRGSLEEELTHTEYLADASKNCEREVAAALVKALGDKGSILVYTSFEKTRIGALQDAFADLAPELQCILDRFLDLHRFVADHIYDPGFRGSFSIKKVLPALAPDLSYEGLAIRDGDTAIARFARMARGEITGAGAAETRRQLLDYCKMDTLAMVRLHETLARLAAGRAGAGGG